MRVWIRFDRIVGKAQTVKNEIGTGIKYEGFVKGDNRSRVFTGYAARKRDRGGVNYTQTEYLR